MVKLPTYDSTKVTALSLSTSQVGFDVGSGAWIDDPFNVTIGFLSRVGISFDFDVTEEPERNLALGLSRPFTNVTVDPAGTGEVSTYWTFTVNTTMTSTNDISSLAPLTLYLVNSARPSVWAGTTNTPSGNISTAQLLFTTHGLSPEFQLNSNGTTYDLVYSLDFLANDALLAKIVNAADWNGLIQFIFDYAGIGSVVFSGASFAGNTNRPHTGLANQPHNRRARVVQDYRTAEFYLSDEAVPDGFLHGIMVHPNNWDPVDPLEDDPFTPPPNEGIVDDEIIDLE